MRYFLISFSVTTSIGRTANGQMSIEDRVFPSMRYIRSMVNEEVSDLETVTIVNIFEFKNQPDYLNFKS